MKTAIDERRPTRAPRPGYVARTLWNWLYSNLHNLHGSYKVVEFAHLRRLGPGLLDAAHPWATGVSPHTGGPVWPEHILFATPRKERWMVAPDADDVIVTRIGRFLSAMVARSTAADPEIPQGSKRRMPHAVNYLHGAIHFSGAFVLFNDFAEARAHLDDPAFLREVRRFARTERREFTLVVRERRYDPVEFAWFNAFIRARLPWYANPNGPGDKRVLYGTPSPYPAVNIINGSWILEMEKLRRGRTDELVRPPIDRARWFQGAYGGPPVGYSAMERFHAWATHQTIRVKGFQGGLVFTRRRRIEPANWEKFQASGGRWRAEVQIPAPFGGAAPDGSAPARAPEPAPAPVP